MTPTISIAVNSVRDGKTNSLNSINFGNHFPVAYKDLFYMQTDTKVFYALQHVEVTREINARTDTASKNRQCRQERTVQAGTDSAGSQGKKKAAKEILVGAKCRK